MISCGTDGKFGSEMAKHPAKFIEACKRSKVDTDELAKQVINVCDSMISCLGRIVSSLT